MKGNPDVIKHLNIILKNELTAINQYFLHAHAARLGFEALGEKVYQESLGEMHHADYIINRVLMLEGLPNLQDLGSLKSAKMCRKCSRLICRLKCSTSHA